MPFRRLRIVSSAKRFDPMAVPTPHFDDDPSGSVPGGLLGELERRQDDVLSQLDDLDTKLSRVLEGLEPGGNGELVDFGRYDVGSDVSVEPPQGGDWEDLPDSADDWA